VLLVSKLESHSLIHLLTILCLSATATYTMDSIPSTFVPPSGNPAAGDDDDSETETTSAPAGGKKGGHKGSHKAPPAVKHTQADLDNLISQQYFRSMNAIGYLEG